MAEFKFNCPVCSQKMLAAEDMAGTQITCPTCRETITVPEAKPSAKEDACVFCGRPITSDSTFCEMCGKRRPSAKSRLKWLFYAILALILLAGLFAAAFWAYTNARKPKVSDKEVTVYQSGPAHPASTEKQAVKPLVSEQTVAERPPVSSAPQSVPAQPSRPAQTAQTYSSSPPPYSPPPAKTTTEHSYSPPPPAQSRPPQTPQTVSSPVQQPAETAVAPAVSQPNDEKIVEELMRHFDDMRDKYKSILDEIQQKYLDRVAQLRNNFATKLDQIEQGLQDKGDLMGVVTLRKEKEAFQRITETPPVIRQTGSSYPEVAGLKTTYNKELDLAQKQRDEERVMRTQQYTSRLAELEKQLTQKGRIDEALSVHAERERAGR